jgi:hypothetical protein
MHSAAQDVPSVLHYLHNAVQHVPSARANLFVFWRRDTKTGKSYFCSHYNTSGFIVRNEGPVKCRTSLWSTRTKSHQAWLKLHLVSDNWVWRKTAQLVSTPLTFQTDTWNGRKRTHCLFRLAKQEHVWLSFTTTWHPKYAMNGQPALEAATGLDSTEEAIIRVFPVYPIVWF